MKKLLSIILIVSFLFCLCACDSPVLPPVRTEGTKGEEHITFVNFTFETACLEAEAIAHVKIGDWLGENSQGTFYDTEVIEVYKGEIPTERIILMQDGNSEYPVKGYPLFTSGNEFLLFLGTGEEENYGNVYWIRGAYSTIVYSAYTKSKEKYFLCEDTPFSETINISKNYYADQKFYKPLYDYMVKADPLLKEENGYVRIRYAFAEEDIVNLIEQSLGKDG